jgi:alpha-1,3/alpha-1,6-mannosyltransferase
VFLRSFSEAQRSALLRRSACVLYTPDREHFGIVPCEGARAGLAGAATQLMCVILPGWLRCVVCVSLPARAAMYSGCPVVAINSGGPRESVVHGETGFLCDSTPASYAAAVRRIVLNPTEVLLGMGSLLLYWLCSCCLLVVMRVELGALTSSR